MEGSCSLEPELVSKQPLRCGRRSGFGNWNFTTVCKVQGVCTLAPEVVSKKPLRCGRRSPSAVCANKSRCAALHSCTSEV